MLLWLCMLKLNMYKLLSHKVNISASSAACMLLLLLQCSDIATRCYGGWEGPSNCHYWSLSNLIISIFQSCIFLNSIISKVVFFQTQSFPKLQISKVDAAALHLWGQVCSFIVGPDNSLHTGIIKMLGTPQKWGPWVPILIMILGSLPWIWGPPAYDSISQ